MVNASLPEGTVLETLYNSIMKQILLFVILCGSFSLTACGNRGAQNAAQTGAPSGTAPSSTGPVASARQKSPKIVAFGDSLTAGYGLQPSQSYPSLLQQKLDADGFQYEVVNAGVSGDTSAGGLRRIDWSLEGDVRILILELGANDFLRGQPTRETRKNLAQIIERCRERNVAVLLAGMLTPTSAGDDYQREIVEVFQSLAKEYDVPMIPFFLENVAGIEKLNQQDRVHPNAEGTKIVADTVYRYLKPMLEKQQAKR